MFSLSVPLDKCFQVLLLKENFPFKICPDGGTKGFRRNNDRRKIA